VISEAKFFAIVFQGNSRAEFLAEMRNKAACMSHVCTQHCRCNKLHPVNYGLQRNMTRAWLCSNETIEIRKKKKPGGAGLS
jgi:hypothetical protein